MGYYDKYNLEKYDPGFYYDRYSYKPQKRVAGYLGQKFHEKKIQPNKYTSRQLNEECSLSGKLHWYNNNKSNFSKCR